MNLVDSTANKRMHTLDEIVSQPACWSASLEELAKGSELQQALEMAEPGREWLFVGCGTSYYLALAAAATFASFGLASRAVPASELLLYPELVLPDTRSILPVMISRSGLTSELVRASRMLQEDRGLHPLAVTCAEGQPLEKVADVTLKLLSADEKSTVMTRSFTSMLLALQYLGAKVAGNSELEISLLQMPHQFAPLLDEIPRRLKAFIDGYTFADYVFLAQGPFFGIASEAMLKMTESSCSYSQVFHAMEFRHGPKSIVSRDTLITCLLSESAYEAEVEVLEEMKQLGGTTMAIGNRLDSRARKAADFAIEMSLSVPEIAQLAAYTVWGQLAGVFTGLKKGLNPDSPKNLSRVGVLAENN